jgi:iron complex outermembrane receptor protein
MVISNAGRQHLAGIVSALIAFASGEPALAAQPAGPDQNSSALEEIVVTAEKREERLQNVPQAISAVTGTTLEAMGAQSFTDYARSIPGLTFQDAGAGRQIPTIRGINPSAGRPAVGYYIDETPIPTSYSGFVVNPELIDLARVEVLRGSQGTLYGSSSIGGTIKLVPNSPNLSQVSGSVKATAMITQGANGGSPGVDSQLVLNIPIVEGIAAVRGALWARDVGGYINRTYGYAGDYGGATPPRGSVGNLPDEHTWGFRVTGLVQPSEQLDISAMAYVQSQHFDGFSDITGGPDNPNDRLVQNFLADVSEPQSNWFELYNVTLKYRAGRVNLISSTSFSNQRADFSMEGMSAIQYFPTFVGPAPPSGVAFPNVAEVKTQTHEFTQEVRLATSETIAGFDAILGAFYSGETQPQQFYWSPPQYNAAVAGNDPSNPLYAPDNNILTAWGPGDYEHHTAEFGELTYHIADSLRLTGGFRHYNVTNGEDISTSGWFVGGNQPGVVSEAISTGHSQGWVYKGNLSYQLTPDHLLYAQYSEGFRPGFGNRPLPPLCGSSNALEVQPDSIKNYEVGAKTDWLDRRLTVNASAYRINWSDIQQGVLLPCGFASISNFGSAVIKGGELEINGKLTQHITAGFSGTYLQAKLQQDLPALGALAGDQIQYVPNWQYGLYAETTFPLLDVNDGFARLDYQYTGSSFSNYARLSDGTRDPSSEVQVVRLLNLRTGLRLKNWEFALSGQNLLNNVVRQGLDPNAYITFSIPGRPLYVVNRPRTFSLSAAYEF